MRAISKGYLNANTQNRGSDDASGASVRHVRVIGLSMRDAGILDGDTVVVRHAPHIAPGAIGVVYLDGEATVKYVHPTRRGVRLLPANPDFAPLEADGERTEIRIAGPVVAVWRMVKGGKRP